MHKSSLARMKWFVDTYLKDVPTQENKRISVLDVGSYDVNGTYKKFFPEDRFLYTGLDMAKGPNVDVVPKNPYNWDCIHTEDFDVVISGQCFEHLEFPWVTFAEMCRVLKKGGLMCLIAPYTCKRHRYPIDCYRYDADSFAAFARYGNLEPLHISRQEAPQNADKTWFGNIEDCILVARKPENWSGMLDVKNYHFEPMDMEKLRTGFLTAEEHPCMH